jgi:Sigma-70 region 2
MEIAGVANGRIYLSGPVKTQNREQALTELIESHRVRLLSIIRKRIRDQVEAEDVLQDVLAEFVEAYDLGQAIEILGCLACQGSTEQDYRSLSPAKNSGRLQGCASGRFRDGANVRQPAR